MENKNKCFCLAQGGSKIGEESMAFDVLFSAELRPWVEKQQSLCFLENHSLNNTHMVDKQKTMVLIVPMGCLNEKPWSQ